MTESLQQNNMNYVMKKKKKKTKKRNSISLHLECVTDIKIENKQQLQ